MKKKKNVGIWVVLHVMLAVFSLGTVCSKFAAAEPFLSFKFILFYGLLIAILGVYAIGWQQVIKRMPLTAAYANRAVSIVWGCIYGVIFFNEQITPGKVIGGVIVATGVVLFALSDQKSPAAEEADEASGAETDETVVTEADEPAGKEEL